MQPKPESGDSQQLERLLIGLPGQHRELGEIATELIALLETAGRKRVRADHRRIANDPPE